MGNPDYQLTLLKESTSRMTCLCVHHDTNVEFGGWANCANSSTPRDRDHVVNNSLYGAEYRCAPPNNGGQYQHKRPSQRLAAFRKKDRREEEECLKFCHLDKADDYAKHYREKKHGLYVEKITSKLGPPFRVLQLGEGLEEHTCFDESSKDGNVDASVSMDREGRAKIRRVSNLLPMVVYSSSPEDSDFEVSQNQAAGHMITLDPQQMNAADGSHVLGRAVLFYSDVDSVARKRSRGYREGFSSFMDGEQTIEFASWIPENAIYQTRSSSAKMYNSVGCLMSERARQLGASFQPLHLHTSHLKRSRYPPSLVVREKQDDMIMVKNSRTKGGNVRTKVEFLTMTSPEKPTAVIKKHLRYLDPLTHETEGVGKEKIIRQHNSALDAENEPLGDAGPYAGRLLYGRMKSAARRVLKEDLQQLAIGKKTANGTCSQSTTKVREKGGRRRKKHYPVEKQDSTNSIPSKTTARSNACDLHIQPTTGSSSCLLREENSGSDNSVASSVLTEQRERATEGGQGTKFTVEVQDHDGSDVVLNCPTVINSSLLATPHRSQGDAKLTNESVRRNSSHTSISNQPHSYPSLQRNDNAHRHASQHHGYQHAVSSYSKLAARQLNQILLNSCTERFLPSSRHHHAGIKLSHRLADRRESAGTGYRVTLTESGNSDVPGQHQIKESSKCLLRSRQRRKAHLQKNILGNSTSCKKVDQLARPHRKQPLPVKVCLRGTKKELVDFLRTNSGTSLENVSCELSELYAE